MEQKRTMLSVDDELGILKMLKDVFELRGWTVMTTPTGASVLPILEKNKIDLILLDIKLPDSSGFDILKQIKEKRSDIPVVIYTAYDYDDELVKKAIKLGAAGYVSKIVSFRELVEVVNNVVIKSKG